jgi:hypothetical protein
MSRAIGSRLPAPLADALAPAQIADAEGFTLLLLSVDDAGWPHQAMLSLGEVTVVDPGRLRLALWPGSTCTRNLTARSPATLTCVVGGKSYAIRLAVRRLDDLQVGAGPTLAAFDAQIEGISADEAPYAVLEAGVRFRLNDREAVLARWADTRRALAEL